MIGKTCIYIGYYAASGKAGKDVGALGQLTSLLGVQFAYNALRKDQVEKLQLHLAGATVASYKTWSTAQWVSHMKAYHIDVMAYAYLARFHAEIQNIMLDAKSGKKSASSS